MLPALLTELLSPLYSLLNGVLRKQTLPGDLVSLVGSFRAVERTKGELRAVFA